MLDKRNLTTKVLKVFERDGFSQKEVSSLTGISTGSLYEYQTGKAAPSLANFLKLVRHAGLRVELVEDLS